MAKKITPYIIFVLIAAAMVWVRVSVGARTEYKLGSQALKKDNLASAVHHFDRSIHWYTPGSDAVANSVIGLQKAAGEYSKKKDLEGQLYAYRILRSALYSVRHVTQPYPEVIATTDEKIANLMALKKGVEGSDNFEKERKLRLEQLTRKVGPKTGYALLAEAGFVGWVASAFLFIWLGIGPAGRFNGRRAMLFSILFVSFYALWIFGLASA